MEWVETTGRSVIEAKDAALDQLGVDEQEAEIHILEEAQKGLFGRLRVEARVRARVRPTAPRAKVERRDRGRRRNRDQQRRKGSSSAGSGKPTATRSSGGSKKPVEASAGGAGGGRGRQGQVAPDVASEAVGPGTQVSGENRSGSSSRRRRRKNNAQRNGSQQGVNVAGNETPDGSGTGSEASEGASSLDMEAQRAAIDEFLTGLLTAFGKPEAEVLTKTSDERTIVAEVQGEELGLLVGPRGLTLQALHELTRSMLQRRFVGGAHARLQLDVAGYRQRRVEALERFAREIVEDVLESGRSKALEPMPANDRKVIHDVVNTIEGVCTVSEGEEPRRCVVIERE